MEERRDAASHEEWMRRNTALNVGNPKKSVIESIMHGYMDPCTRFNFLTFI
jgi:hypothetical protein